MEKKKKMMPRLSKEVTVQGGGESSFRVLYYGESGAAVPFKWESQPGTPKHELFSDLSVPPLTPPPSYATKKSGEHESVWRSRKNRSVKRSKLSAVVLLTNFPKLARRNSHVSSMSNSSSSSSAYSDSPMHSSTPRNPGRSIGSCLEDDLEEEAVMSSKGGPMSALVCFGCGDRSPMSCMKNTLFSVVACRRSTRSVDYIV